MVLNVFIWKENKAKCVYFIIIICIAYKKKTMICCVVREREGGNLFIEGETLLFSGFLWSHRSSRFQTTFLFF